MNIHYNAILYIYLGEEHPLQMGSVLNWISLDIFCYLFPLFYSYVCLPRAVMFDCSKSLKPVYLLML